MKSIAIVGGGIASIGAIARIVESIDDKSIGPVMRVDQYSAPLIGAEIRTRGTTYRLPNSGERGYMARWGAVLGLRLTNTSAFRAFADVFLDGDALNRSGLNFESRLLSYESDDVPYLCLNSGAANDRVSRLITRAKKNGVLRQIKAEVLELQKGDAGWQLKTNLPAMNATYDRIVLCAGPIRTPVLLANSDLIDENRPYSLMDHVIQFGGAGETTTENALNANCREIQIVNSKLTASGHSHDVQINRLVSFRPKYMENLYWRIAGRTRAELFSCERLHLISALTKAAFLGLWFLPSKKNSRITVHDCKSCDVSLKISNGKPIIEWSSILQPGAVSAFHFHGSLNDCQDTSTLENVGIHIGDLSLSHPLKGINNGCASFQAGFIAMKNALES